MLTIPLESLLTTCVVGIDPGTETLGVAIINFDIATFEISKVEAFTLLGSKLVDRDNWSGEVHGDRFARIEALGKKLEKIFLANNPIQVGCESAFYSQRRPSAFSALSEVINAIRKSVYNYNSWRSLLVIDPPTVKKAIGASGNADKKKVKETLLTNKEISLKTNRPISEMDEHSVDAICVAYCIYSRLYKGTI